VVYTDPHVPVVHFDSGDLKSKKLNKQLLKSSVCTVILTNHSSYDYKWVVDSSNLVFDTRNATRDIRVSKKKVAKL